MSETPLFFIESPMSEVLILFPPHDTLSLVQWNWRINRKRRTMHPNEDPRQKMHRKDSGGQTLRFLLICRNPVRAFYYN